MLCSYPLKDLTDTYEFRKLRQEHFQFKNDFNRMETTLFEINEKISTILENIHHNKENVKSQLNQLKKKLNTYEKIKNISGNLKTYSNPLGIQCIAPTTTHVATTTVTKAIKNWKSNEIMDQRSKKIKMISSIPSKKNNAILHSLTSLDENKLPANLLKMTRKKNSSLFGFFKLFLLINF